jgi:hypothetical protein
LNCSDQASAQDKYQRLANHEEFAQSYGERRTVVNDKRGPLKMYFVGKWPDGGKGRLTGRDLVSVSRKIGRAGFAGCAARSFKIRLAVSRRFKEPPAEPGAWVLVAG